MNENSKQNFNKQRRVIWLYCTKCGKRMLRRLPNGVFAFEYGRKRNDPDAVARVRIMIYGDVKMRCLNIKCGNENVFNMLPVPPKNREAQT